ncbi:putative protein DUF3857 [Leeuwenhoekiella aestuarii]|uniref:DUF3857 domain-containing protein n=1 Tax=Leeuwenhoekiella aestuarii TaxID=2249426 RepID=A0A4Q0NTF4_9FLAO|nr:DUF3857 domain-containing protein [Leeuwenhoekiella aestuarii]RXG14020.1 putative protein DUF3857 [Leeuwenhoekiella aestuarii]RXG18769.1 putative protein DUF3857 [Leeuwenhoekiella aestuarii]
MARKLIFLLFVIPLLTHSQQLELSALTVDPELSDGADSVLRHEEITFDLSDEGKLRTTISRLVTVYNKAGLSDVKAYAGYDNNSKVSGIEAVIYTVTGVEKDKFKKRDFKDVSAVSGGTLYADSRVLYLDYTPTSYPFTIQFNSERVSETTAFLWPWMPVSRYASGTEYSKFTIIHNPEDTLHIKETNLEKFGITKEETPGKTTWVAKNLEPVTFEYRSKGLDERVPRVKCFFDKFYLAGVPGIAGNWKDFGKWMNEKLVKDTQDLDAVTIAEIQELTKDLPNDEAKARAVYQFVQDKVRYISVQVEIGGWKPMLASDVQRLSYGDCKALSNYTQSLLNAVGVKSYYTVLYGDRGKESLETDVVAMQGNHAILGVQLGDEIKFLECTSQETPFGYMGRFTDDREVLLLTEDGGRIVKTTKYDQEDNTDILNANLVLDETGNLSGEVAREAKGIFYADRMNLDRKDDKDLSDYYYETWSGINSLSVSDIKLNNNRLDVVYDEKLNCDITGYTTSVSDNMLVRANPFALSREAIPPRYRDRKTGFVNLRGTIEKQNIEIIIPEGYVVNALPESVEYTEEFGTYQVSYKLEGDKLTCKRMLKFNEGDFTVEAYEKYRDFYKTIVKHDNQKLLIEKI